MGNRFSSFKGLKLAACSEVICVKVAVYSEVTCVEVAVCSDLCESCCMQ